MYLLLGATVSLLETFSSLPCFLALPCNLFTFVSSLTVSPHTLSYWIGPPGATRGNVLALPSCHFLCTLHLVSVARDRGVFFVSLCPVSPHPPLLPAHASVIYRLGVCHAGSNAAIARRCLICDLSQPAEILSVSAHRLVKLPSLDLLGCIRSEAGHG